MKKIFQWIALGVVGLIFIGMFNDKETSACDKYGAYSASVEFVSRQLKSPASAEFSGINETEITETGNCAFTVKGFVDAQNSFGAKIRTTYQVRAIFSGNSWSLQSINIQ